MINDKRMRLKQEKQKHVTTKAKHILTFYELYHLLMGHGGNQRAVHLSRETESVMLLLNRNKKHRFPHSVTWKAVQTFMILSPSWTPAFTAAPPEEHPYKHTFKLMQRIKDDLTHT